MTTDNEHEDAEKKVSAPNKWEALVEEEVEAEKTPSIELIDRETLEKQLTEMETKASMLEDKLLRTHAEHENMLRRVKQDMENTKKYHLKDFARELLPVVDSLERCLDMHADEMESVKEGVQLTLKMLLDALAKHGVQIIHPLDQLFNPALHEAMSTEVREDIPPGTVLKVLQKGYQLHDRLIRPALVIVAKAP